MLTFLFTDIEGSTSHWESETAAMREALALHDELLHEAIGAQGGEVFKHTGDGVCAVFSSAVRAVDAQQLLSRAAWPTSSPIRARMGVHTGEAIRNGSDYFGPALNRIGRLHAIAHGGQVVISAATEVLVRQRIPDTLSVRSLGRHKLRDLPDPQKVFQVGLTDEHEDFAELRTGSTVESRLPTELTSFVGRHDEIDAVSDALAR
ncbi:MAG: adenylate/guanylate cyclase domain-containing protein, partial [Actinomycetota bacterium]|nr:adenylate/guanylate cyclase domain-containing protein [Actinomycetota bacterium]